MATCASEQHFAELMGNSDLGPYFDVPYGEWSEGAAHHSRAKH